MVLCLFLFVSVQSGKLVMKMFQKIQELIEDPNALVCVLIDEVRATPSPHTTPIVTLHVQCVIRVAGGESDVK